MYKIILIFAITLSVFLISCSDDNSNQNSEHTNSKTFTPTGESIFNLTSEWENQKAETIKLKHFAGKPTIMAMIYTHCKYSCPLIVADMKSLQEKLPDNIKGKVNFLLVSIDPEYDKPDTLNQFMQKEQMDQKYWTMLCGTESEIRELAAAVGFGYKKSSLMDYAHTNLISVLNEKGEIVEQINGFGSDKKEIIDKVKEIIG